MAEQEITYIPYGLDEISQQDLMNNLANGVSEYLDSKRWAKKDKYRLAWLAAYQDIMDRGLAGASNDTGIWRINHRKDPIDLDNKSTLDREMYLDAAYYIQLKMSLITPRKKEEEKKKEDLIPFNFKTDFNKYLLKGYGNDWDLFADPEQGWDAQDERGANGLRATTNRRLAMLNALKNYMNSLEDGKYNFEGTTFTDLNDAKAKIQTAIDALNTPDEKDDFPAFNALGLQYRTYFSNGGNDPSGYSIDGNPVTWSLYAKHLNDTKTTEAKAKVDAAKKKLALQQANRYNYVTRSSIKMIGRNPQELASKYQNDLELLQQLNKYAQTPKLTGDEWSDIVGAFNFYNSKGALLNLSKLELERFLGLRTYNGLGPGVLKKIPGVEGFYYDTRTGLVVKPGRTDLQISQPINGLLELNNPEYLHQKAQEIQNSKKLSDEDWDIIGADTVSMFGDIVSLGGGYAGAAGGITTLISDLYADIKRGKDFWDTVKNLAKNTAWGFAGLIPGAKLAKLGKKAALLYALYNSFGVITDPDVHKSWLKLINGEDFTSHDFENLKWTLHAVVGAHNTVRSHYTDKALLNKTLKTVVETKNGTKPITSSQIKEVNKAGGRGGLLKALDKFKEITGEEAKPNQFLFNTEGRKWYNPTRYSQKLRNLTSDENILKGKTQFNKTVAGRLLVLDRNKPIIANPFSTSTYKNWFTGGGPNRGYTTMALAKSFNNVKQNQLSNQQQQNLQQPQQLNLQQRTREILDNFLATGKTPKSPKHNMTRKEWRKANKKLYDNINRKGRFTNQMPEEGTYKFKDPTGNTHTFKLIYRDDDFLLDIKSSNGSSKQVVLTLDLVKNGIWNNIKKSLNVGLRNDISLPANIIRTLQGTAYGWLKQGGTIDKPIDTMIENFFKNNKL